MSCARPSRRGKMPTLFRVSECFQEKLAGVLTTAPSLVIFYSVQMCMCGVFFTKKRYI